MTKKVDSLKHKADKRAHIPSKEEAGYEDANPKVAQGNKTLELPLNPVTTRGRDPELFWMNKYGNDDREALLRVDIRSLYRHEHIAPGRKQDPGPGFDWPLLRSSLGWSADRFPSGTC